jgi:hypothetical protein
MEEIKSKCKVEDDVFLNQTILFNEPLIMYEGDEFIMEYDDSKVIFMSIRRKK